MKIPAGALDFWYSVSVSAVLELPIFDPAATGLGDIPFAKKLGSKEEGPCQTTARLELHHPEEGGEFEPHYHLRMQLQRRDPTWQPSPDALAHEEFLVSMIAGFVDPTVELDISVVANLELPRGTSWRLPVLTNPPEVTAESDDLGSISLAGVSLDFSDSTLGLNRVFMETDFRGQPSQFKIMHHFRLRANDLEEVLVKSIEFSRSHSELFVQGLPHE